MILKVPSNPHHSMILRFKGLFEPWLWEKYLLPWIFSNKLLEHLVLTYLVQHYTSVHRNRQAAGWLSPSDSICLLECGTIPQTEFNPSTKQILLKAPAFHKAHNFQKNTGADRFDYLLNLGDRTHYICDIGFVIHHTWYCKCVHAVCHISQVCI